ncbi:astacin-like metalloprotease toxin 1 [Porites lutea]|uniref:astacin-like metalloprotease toxin 1 n=1 Tax=Porites lutea TaxID=51062 RepID=UPI003CC6C50F
MRKKGISRRNGTRKLFRLEKQDDAVLNSIEGLNTDIRNNLYEADIVLSDEEKKQVDQREEGDADGPGAAEDLIKRNAVRNRQKLWKSRVVPYRISPALYRAKSVIMAAIKEFHRHTCLRFKPRGKERSWIRFVKRPGCWSRVGKQFSSTGPQLLSVGPGCDKKGIIMHELMHAVGFWHEQSRTDRNKYVEVLWENVAKGQAHNFNKYSHGKLDYLGAMYDFQSLMHYGSRAFSKNGKRTIKALKQPGVEFGQRKGFSETDIQQLNALYDCKTDSSHPWSSWTKFGPCNDRCQKIRQRFCMSRDRNQCYGVGTYGIQKQTETCSLNECYAPIPGHWGRWSSWSSCGVTCGPGHRFRSRLCDDPPPKYGGTKCLGTRVQAERCWNKNC